MQIFAISEAYVSCNLNMAFVGIYSQIYGNHSVGNVCFSRAVSKSDHMVFTLTSILRIGTLETIYQCITLGLTSMGYWVKT